MAQFIRNFNRGVFSSFKIGIALSVTVSAIGFPAFADNPVNTVNDGRVVNGGTFYNTADGKTTFINSGKGGLWVRDTTTIRGFQADAQGNPNNNGGTLHFYAPNGVVRVDGQINVNANANSSGAMLGNGGNVFVDAAYYFQDGQIFANGINGGLVQLNVGSATIQPGATIQAKGLGGAGGVIAINSDGVVHIKPNTLLDTSGKVAGTYDSNLINIEAGVVRSSGIIRADGAVTNAAEGSRGGTVRLVATGNTNLAQVQQALQDSTTPGTQTGQLAPTFASNERDTLNRELNETKTNYDGQVFLRGTFDWNNNRVPIRGFISANGTSGAIAGNNDTAQDSSSRAGDGGTIILSAMKNVHTFSTVQANGGVGASGSKPVNGGNGGAIIVTAGNAINTDLFTYTTRNAGLVGQLQADGGAGGRSTLSTVAGANGGKGGLLGFGYQSGMMNRGDISARGGNGGAGARLLDVFTSAGGNGGQGGLAVLSGPTNPTNGGAFKADGGNGGQGKNLLSSNAVGGVAGLIVSPNPGTFAQSQNVSQKAGNPGLNQFTPRGFGAQRALTETTSENELITHNENLVLLTRNVINGLRLEHSDERAQNAKIRSVADPFGTGAAANQILAKDGTGSLFPYRNFVIGSSANGLGLTLVREPAFYINGSQEVGLSSLNTLTVLNRGGVTNTYEWGLGSSTNKGGGRLSILATGSIQNGMGFTTRGAASGGSINFASQTSVDNFDLLATQSGNAAENLYGGSIMLNSLGGITNYGYRLIGSQGRLAGGTQRFNANGAFVNLGDLQATALGNTANLPVTGGNIQIRGASVQNGSEEYSPVFLHAEAISNNAGYGGNVGIHSPSINNNLGDLNVNGSRKNGQIVLTP